MRISSFMIGVVVAMLIVMSFTTLLSSTATKYNTTYNESDVETYNKLQEMQNITKEIQDKTDTGSEKTGALDIVGGFLSDAISSLKIAWQSYDIFTDMAEHTYSGFGDIFQAG